jgi:hypothetical protein
MSTIFILSHLADVDEIQLKKSGNYTYHML